MYIFGKNNNHLIKNNYKATFSLPQKVKLINKPILKCACGPDFIICLTQDLKIYCYFQSAIYNIEFKPDLKIIDIETEQNLILFVTQQGELYATEFLAQKIVNDCLKPKPVKLSLPFSSSKEKIIKKIVMVDGNIFLKMQNNQIVQFKKNDWMETKSFSDPKLVLVSKTCDIIDIKSLKDTFYFLTKEGTLYSALQNQLSVSFQKVELKQKLKKINSNKSQLFGINQLGQIVKIEISNNKAKFQRLWKISAKFSDLLIGEQNFYSITEQKQAWVWGKNSHGQLGLSDYDPRNCLYPLVSLQNFYIKNIFIGQNYVCCIVDDLKIRDPVKEKQRQSVKSSFRQMKSFSTQNNFMQCKDSLNQTDEFLMPIRYTEQESKNSLTDQNQSCSDITAKSKNKANQFKDNRFRKSIKSTKKPSERESFKNSLTNQNSFNKVSNRNISNISDRKIINKSVRSNSKSPISHSRSFISTSKLTPKSINGEKSYFRLQKGKSELKNDLKEHESNKSAAKSHKREPIVSYKGHHMEAVIRQSDKKSVHKQCRQNLDKQLNEKDKKQKQNFNALTQVYKMQKQRLKDMIASLEGELQSKRQQNKDLYELLSQKNVTISDITKKIQLLQSAIEQHEKALTVRDNEAQQFYLREKEYQLHIQKLQSQVEKMMQVLNYNQRNKQTEMYKKQMQRLSFDIKSRMDDEKQYNRQRIVLLEKKFDEQRNVYQLEIRKLQEQVVSLRNQNISLMLKNEYKINDPKFYIQTAGLSNNSSNCMESPTFHTLDMKQNLKRQIQGNYLLNESQITLQDQINQNHRIPLQQSNGHRNISPLQIKLQQENVTRKNSRSNRFSNKIELQNDENNLDSKSQSQVKEILSKIEVTKSYISKSANKLFNILQKEKV